MKYYLRFFYASGEVRDFYKGFSTVEKAKQFGDNELRISKTRFAEDEVKRTRLYHPDERLARYQIIERLLY